MKIHTFTEELKGAGVTLHHEVHLLISEGTVYLMLILDGIHGEHHITKPISRNPKYINWLHDNFHKISLLFDAGYKAWFRSPDHTNGATKYHFELVQHIHEMYNDNK